jgi:hypothetical protein
MEEWQQRFAESGGSIACTGNCPEHMSCSGHIRPRGSAGKASPIDGYVPLAACDRCKALFGFEHRALRFLQHR